LTPSAYRNALHRACSVVLVAVLFAGLAGAVRAQGTAAGQVVAVVGEVRLVGRDGAERPVQRGGELREGDTVVTGPNALVQVRLADGGFLSIRPDTETTLERFAYAGSDDRNASMFLALLKGGFRSVTGLIGQLNRPGYRITTPSATIGIRGTDHEPFVVTPQTAAALQMPAGTYDRVHSGQTFIQNRQGLTQFANPNQTLFVSDAGARPQLLPTPPPALYRIPTPVSGSPQPLQPDPDRRGPQAGGGTAGDQKGPAVTPGGARAPSGVQQIQTTPSPAQTIQTAPALQGPSTTSPIMTAPSPAQTIQTAPTLQGPTTTSPIMTTPSPATIQTAPTLQGPTTSPIMTSPAPAQTIQTPPSVIQQSPMTSPMTKPMAPTAPITAPPR
jgi:hypothetical protein